MLRTEQHQERNVDRLPEHEFIEQLCNIVNSGFGLVPFLGSGCSSASGILMGQQFTDYLAFTIFICVAKDKDLAKAHANAPSIPSRRWDLRQRGWPQHPDQDCVEIARRWLSVKFQELCARCDVAVYTEEGGVKIQGLQIKKPGATPDELARALNSPLLPPILRGYPCDVDQKSLKRLHAQLDSNALISGGILLPNISPTSEDAIIERAIRSLYDWRATLHFLSELQLVKIDPKTHTLMLAAAQPKVIDRFNVHITRGRMPNLAHIMLCHLARPARMRLFLTTNFDELIEDAFTQLGQNIEPISVSIRGELPDPEIVHARDTVVKMHGTLWETRADFSLDESPPQEEKRRFFHYVRGCDPIDSGHSNEERYLPQHLLVCGYSGSDNRCVELIKYVLDCDPRARLFWICYNEADLARIDALFGEEIYHGRITTVVTERLDLLLYEWYQRLCLCLPAGGGSHQFIHNVPPEESFRPHPIKKRHLAPGARKIIDEFKWLQPERPRDKGFHDNTRNKLVVIDGPSGLLSASRDAFHELSDRYSLNKIWLELEDYAGPASVGHEIFQIIAIRLGLFQLEHCAMPPSAIEKIRSWDAEGKYTKEWENEYLKDLEICYLEIKQLCRHFGTRPQSWLIVLYGRNGPGGCAGWKEGNFWNTDEYGESGSDSPPTPFAGMLSILVELGFNIIYIPYSAKRKARDDEKLDHLRTNYPLDVPNGEETDVEMFPNHSKTKSDAKGRIHSPTTIEGHFSYRINGARDERGNWKLVFDNGVRLDSSISRVAVCDLETDILNGHNLDRHAEGRIDQMWDLWVSSGSKTHNRDTESRTKSLKRLRNVVYAASLFRQSRHFSAFLSEAVYRCPDRYNKKGIDNDVSRAQRVEEWLQEFHEHKVFFRKPGGFAWAYRDMRSGLRWLIHHADKHDMPRDNLAVRSKSSDSEAISPMLQFRCRTHYYIGDWYMRAVFTSGHAVPLMEAMYHFAQAAYHAWKSSDFPKEPETTGKGKKKSAKLKNIPDESQTKLLDYWLKSVFNIIRCLRTGSSTIRFWFDKPTVEAWFGEEAQMELMGLIFPCCGSDDKSPFEHAVKDRFGSGLLQSLQQRLSHEVDLIYKRQQSSVGSFRIHEWERYTPLLSALNQNTDKQPTDRGFEEPDWLDELIRKGGAHDSRSFFRCSNNSKQIFGKLDRSSIHSTIGAFVKEVLLITVEEQEHAIWKAVGKVIDQFLLTDGLGTGIKSQKKLFCEMQLLIEWAFTLTRYAKRLDRLYNLRSLNKELSKKHSYKEKMAIDPRSLWLATCILCSAAQDVASHIDPALGGFTMRETSKALTIYGLALSRLHRFSEAHRRWNEAEAILRHSGVADMQVLRGIIELRRAEGYLLESRLAIQIGRHTHKNLPDSLRPLVCKVGIKEDMKNGALDEFIKNLAESCVGPDATGLKQWITRHCGMSHKSHDSQCERVVRRMVRLHLSRIGDAWRCLENAQRLFAGKTHSPRWWSRLYSLQLRCYAEQESSVELEKLLKEADQEQDQRVFRTLPFRIRRDVAYHITRLLDRGQVANSEGAHPKLTLLDYALRAFKFRKLEDDLAHDEHLKKMIQELLVKTGALVGEEAQNQNKISSLYLKEVQELRRILFD